MIAWHRFQNYFSLHFVKYPLYEEMFSIRLVDFNGRAILCQHLISCFNNQFGEN